MPMLFKGSAAAFDACVAPGTTWLALASALLAAACTGSTGTDSAGLLDGTTAGAFSSMPGSGPGSVPGGGGAAASGATSTTSVTNATAGAEATAGGAGVVSMLPGAVDACATASVDVGLTKLRRLTRDQLNNTLRDLLGVQGEPAAVLVPDERIGPFESNSIAPVTDLIVQQHSEIAALAAQDAVPRMNEVAGCDLTADATCAPQFIQNFGMRAFRRPLEDGEATGLLGLYEIGRSAGGAGNGFRLVVEAMLQAPSFLYIADTGTPGTVAAEPVPVEPYGLASRLSYFLWNTMPDEQLFARAQDGSLTQDAELGVQVDRMLRDERAAKTIGLFHIQLLRLDHLAEADKDASVFPQFNTQLAEAMLRETAAFASNIVLKGDGLLSTLLTASYSYPEGGLFQLYGIDQPPGYQLGDPVELDPAERSGLLTHAAFLTSHAKRNATSPVHRGIIIRENLMCQTIPPPPGNVTPVLPPETVATTTRERFAQHLADPSCAACHSLIDPIGLSFENYDGIGGFRTMDGDNAVDASGAIVGGGDDLAFNYDNAVQMTKLLGTAQVVQDCVATQWFRFALGRTDSTADGCSMSTIRSDFAASAGSVPALLKTIVSSDAFRYVRTTASQETL